MVSHPWNVGDAADGLASCVIILGEVYEFISAVEAAQTWRYPAAHYAHYSSIPAILYPTRPLQFFVGSETPLGPLTIKNSDDSFEFNLPEAY